MNYLLIKEKTTNNSLLINANNLVSISFNTIMNSIVLTTIFTTYQCENIELIDTETFKKVINNFNQLCQK